jgi:hypothetical protein
MMPTAGLNRLRGLGRSGHSGYDWSRISGGRRCAFGGDDRFDGIG